MTAARRMSSSMTSSSWFLSLLLFINFFFSSTSSSLLVVEAVSSSPSSSIASILHMQQRRWHSFGGGSDLDSGHYYLDIHRRWNLLEVLRQVRGGDMKPNDNEDNDYDSEIDDDDDEDYDDDDDDDEEQNIQKDPAILPKTSKASSKSKLSSPIASPSLSSLTSSTKSIALKKNKSTAIKSKIQVAMMATTTPTSSSNHKTSIKKKKNKNNNQRVGGRGLYQRYVPYILRACLNPFTFIAMTKAYFVSLCDINYLKEEEQTQTLRSALAEKARKQSPPPSTKPKRKMKPGQAKTISDLPQLSA